MNEQDMIALFRIAGIPVQRHWKLMNGYWPIAPAFYETIIKSPWWLVQTSRGMICIGWRKRVIEIDWRDTDIRKEVTGDYVTKSESLVHAWTVLKAAEYLTALWSNSAPREEDAR